MRSSCSLFQVFFRSRRSFFSSAALICSDRIDTALPRRDFSSLRSSSVKLRGRERISCLSSASSRFLISSTNPYASSKPPSFRQPERSLNRGSLRLGIRLGTTCLLRDTGILADSSTGAPLSLFACFFFLDLSDWL